ncbi:sensor histidine kinase [Desmospora profundinema]|uniref:histidine kinase n=1 Tax=Desmospora profundinema TaxID=1571184 RepID=A0ABU1IKT5_9BACL|nr:sensor histidine kinase [Desmospora profundinema]MDR6224425.1 signal transduction histidine kinase [Desmospora profundinema]
MRLFLREQIPLLIIYGLQLVLILGIYRLAGFQNWWIALYAALLSAVLFVGYLCYRYWSLRSFYYRLTFPMETLDESIRDRGGNPLSKALNELLKTQYQHYKGELHHYESKIRNHVTFINQWVHQMKTPLSVIHLTIQDEDDPIFDSIREESDRIGKGLETVLHTARLDSFEQDFHVEPVRLNTVVHQVIQENKGLFIRNRVYPEVYVDETLTVESDEKWLAFVLGQLLTNAVKYSVETGEKIVLSSWMRGPHAVLQVTDYGIGIPKKDLQRVFEPYFTGEHGRKYPESTGMGLYLVREVCRRLNHGVELTSKVGKGTTVRIIFLSPVPPVPLHESKEGLR